MKNFGFILFTLIGLFFSTGDIAAQQSVSLTTFDTDAEPTFTKTLTVDKRLKKLEFSEIKTNYLPQVLQDALREDFSDAKTKEAFVKQKDGNNLYKIILEVNGTTKEVYCDVNGNWTHQNGIQYI